MSHDPKAEVHQYDIGSKYQVEVEDDGQPFDPSTAVVKEIWFLLPDGTPTGTKIVKPAQVETDGSPATKWYLTYQVTPGSGPPGSPQQEFHERVGHMKVQIFLQWSDSTQFHGDILITDTQGRLLKVHPNLQ